MDELTKTIDSIRGWLVVIVLSVLPIFFLSTTQDFYDFNKWSLLVFTTVILVLLWAVRAVTARHITMMFPASIDAFALLTIASLATLLIVSPNKADGASAVFGVGTFVALALFLLVVPKQLFEHAGGLQRILRWGLYLTTSIASLLAIYQYLGIGKLLFPGSFLANALWTPAGTTLGAAVLFLLIAPIMVGEAITGYFEKNESKTVVLSTGAILVAAGLILTVYQMIPTLGSSILPLQYGWAIMLEALKGLKYAVFGVGAENFINAFAAGRPVGLNMTSLWNVRFLASSSFALHIVTTLGLLGGLGVLFLLRSLLLRSITSFNLGKTSPSSGSWIHYGLCISFVIGIAAVLLAPPSLALLIAIFTLILITEDKPYQLSWAVPKQLGWIPIVLVVLVTLAFGAGSYGLGRVYLSEMLFYDSLKAIETGDGTKVYNLQIKALEANPQNTRMHISFSQTNFALADAVARAATSATPSGQQAGTISDADRGSITSLISQSVREAKIALQLSPQNMLAWENIANLYGNLVGIAQNAEQFTIAAFQQSIALDPTNPLLRMRLGGVFVGTNSLEAALQQFTAAANLKPDFANAYYNIANVYALKNDTKTALAALEETLKYVPSGSDDAMRVEKDIEALKKQAQQGAEPSSSQPAAGAQQEPTLTTPQEPDVIIKPPIELPPEAEIATPSAGSGQAPSAEEASPSSQPSP